MKSTFLLIFFTVISTVNAQKLVISELDSDTPGTDIAEFIELYSTNPNYSLNGYVLVFFNGNGDKSYAAYDLDGYSTDSNGYFTLGDSGVNGISITLNSSGLQNGADAVALYQANLSDFPANTLPSTANLVDALVYDTDEADDTGLLTALGETTQYNENEASDGSNHSLQLQTNGSYSASSPTPNAANTVLSTSFSKNNLVSIKPNPTNGIVFFIDNKESLDVKLYDMTGKLQLVTTTTNYLDVSHFTHGIYLMHINQGQQQQLMKLIIN